MNLIEIHFDGGCRPSNPGNKYGSFAVLLDHKPIFKASRIELGYGTNNEAEFDILIEALKWTADNLNRGGFETRFYSINLYTDSMVVANRVSKHNSKAKGEAGRRMAALTKRVLSYIGQYKDHSIEWRRRDDNVIRFGH